jgi:hypothetical protein
VVLTADGAGTAAVETGMALLVQGVQKTRDQKNGSWTIAFWHLRRR